MKNLTVQKFGGTSMGSAARMRAVARLILEKNEPTVVVVSAMNGVTSMLLDLVTASAAGTTRTKKKLLQSIADRHHETARALVGAHPASHTTLTNAIDDTLDRLTAILDTVDSPTPPPRVLDSILAIGERLSAQLLAAYISTQGTSATAIDLKTAIPGRFRSADAAFYAAAEKNCAKAIQNVLKKNHIPIATGYFGHVPGGMSASVGRGYSDFCAALIAAGLGATELQIWTDVSGVYSADPRKIPEAELIDRMTFESAAELAHFGAKIIHPQCIHPAVRAQIPVRIKNTFAPDEPGTRILSRVPHHRRPVAAVTAKKPITVLHVVSLRKLVQHDFLAQLFAVLARHNVPADVVSTSEVSVSLACDRSIAAAVARAIQHDLGGIARVERRADQAIVCVVGGGMIGNCHIAGELFSVIGAAGINIRQISQGASERNITCIIDARDADRAVATIHKHFIG